VIVTWLLELVFGFFNWILGTIPEGSAPPDWLSGGTDAVSSLLVLVSSMGAWIPLDLCILMANLVLLSMVVSSSVKFMRILLSLFTGGGGSAA
jgi:hypothetical protein